MSNTAKFYKHKLGILTSKQASLRTDAHFALRRKNINVLCPETQIWTRQGVGTQLQRRGARARADGHRAGPTAAGDTPRPRWPLVSTFCSLGAAGLRLAAVRELPGWRVDGSPAEESRGPYGSSAHLGSQHHLKLNSESSPKRPCQLQHRLRLIRYT